jgi:hypothetical protein
MANDIVTLRASSSQLKFGRTSARALVPHASGAHLGESDLLLAGEGGPKAVPSGADKRSQECRRAWVSLGRGPVRKFCRPIGTWLHLHHGGVRLRTMNPCHTPAGIRATGTPVLISKRPRTSPSAPNLSSSPRARRVLVALRSDSDGLDPAVRLARAGVSDQRGPRCCEECLAAF